MSQDTPSAESARQPQRIRLPLRFRRLRVLSVEHPSSAFIRIVLGGEELDGFNSPGFDDHAKLFFPDPDTGELRLPTVAVDGPVWPEGPRPIARDYTPRRHDPEAGTLAIDFVLHQAGPATDWARSARPGDRIGVGGPRGSTLIPVDYDWHLLVGDETALPAIARRLEDLPTDTRAIVVAETDRSRDELPLSSPARLTVHWRHRAGVAAGSSGLLLDALARLDLPAGEGFAWIACESREARALRLHLTRERDFDPRRIKAAGYWRRGAVGAHDSIED